ncbi:Sperm Acrosome-Associated Protein 7 [Manis pentadactyla]|nr:Sperm Acrosome-Associated Protein 7 [Manis pentadactyla]
MAAGLAVTFPVLLLSCWREADLQPLSGTPGPATEVPSNSRNLDNDIATVFDKILVQEILDPDESAEAETQATAGASATKLLREKKEDKETMDQIKSPAALEKIIDSLARAAGNPPNQRRKQHKKSVRRRQIP